MVYRVFVEKKAGLDNEAQGLLSEARNLLGIASLENLRLFNRYDAENISKELFDYAVKAVFSEPLRFRGAARCHGVRRGVSARSV